jgi:hypothetical protein
VAKLVICPHGYKAEAPGTCNCWPKDEHGCAPIPTTRTPPKQERRWVCNECGAEKDLAPALSYAPGDTLFLFCLGKCDKARRKHTLQLCSPLPERLVHWQRPAICGLPLEAYEDNSRHGWNGMTHVGVNCPGCLEKLKHEPVVHSRLTREPVAPDAICHLSWGPTRCGRGVSELLKTDDTWTTDPGRVTCPDCREKLKS